MGHCLYLLFFSLVKPAIAMTKTKKSQPGILYKI
jgi:hypothetical protein